MTEITVRVLGPGDPTPTPETYSDELKQPIKNGATVQTTLVTYGKKGNMEGSRKSKRIRQVREHGKRRKFTITKTMTVKDLKVMVSTSYLDLVVYKVSESFVSSSTKTSVSP